MPQNPDRSVVDFADPAGRDPGNLPSSEGIRAGAPLALEIGEKGRGVFRGLLVALLALGSSACLVPQSVDSSDTTPHTVPVIDLSSLPIQFMTPSNILYKQTTGDKAQGCRCQMQLLIPAVNDDDPTVDLEARWYLDYDLGNPTSQAPVFQQDLPGSFTNSGRTRTGPVFNFDADSLNIPGGKQHVVEVVIAERQAFDDSQGALFPHRSLKKDFEGTSLKFVVDVQDSQANVLQCDRNTPLQAPPMIRPCGQ